MTAILDTTRTYRYRLTRPAPVGPFVEPCLWVMLNPSTADETADDPTIRKLVGFQTRVSRGHRGAVEVVNLFSLRATDPRELAKHHNPIGLDNDQHIAAAARDVREAGGRLIVAWGAHRFAHARGRAVAEILYDYDAVWCLGMTKDGSPRHPLYVPYSQPLVRWEGYR